MPASMNQMVFELEYDCSRIYDSNDIPLDLLEDKMMERPHQTGKSWKVFTSPEGYWKRELGLAK
jgi:hypothetical protein